MRLRYVVVALLVGALSAGAVAACGGDDDAPITPVETETAPVEALSKDDFIDEVDSICERANGSLERLAETSAGDPASLIASQREIIAGMVDQIEGLEAPDEDKSALNSFIDALEELSDNLQKQELAASRDDTASLGELELEETTIRTELASAAEEYGFKDCGQEGDAVSGTGEAGADTGTVDPSAPAPAPDAAPAPAPDAAPAPAPEAPPSGGTEGGGESGGTAPGGGGGESGGVSP